MAVYTLMKDCWMIEWFFPVVQVQNRSCTLFHLSLSPSQWLREHDTISKLSFCYLDIETRTPERYRTLASCHTIYQKQTACQKSGAKQNWIKSHIHWSHHGKETHVFYFFVREDDKVLWSDFLKLWMKWSLFLVCSKSKCWIRFYHPLFEDSQTWLSHWEDARQRRGMVDRDLTFPLTLFDSA